MWKLLKRILYITGGLALIAGIAFLLYFFGTEHPSEGEVIDAGLNPKRALIVMNMQDDYLTPEGRYPNHPRVAEEILENINTVIHYMDTKATELIYVKDGRSSSDFLRNLLRHRAGIEGNPGAELTPDLNVINNVIFNKRRADAFTSSAFNLYLRSREISALILVGTHASESILQTGLAARQRGYAVTVVSDAVADPDAGDLRDALAELRKAGAVIKTTRVLLQDIPLTKHLPYDNPGG